MSGRGPEISSGERAVGYLVPIVLCGLVGAGVAGWLYASGGPRTSRRTERRLDLPTEAERALAATSSRLKVWAAVGFVAGGLAGAGLAAVSERRSA